MAVAILPESIGLSNPKAPDSDSEAPTQPGRTWQVRCDETFLAARLSDAARVVFMVLDGFARDRPFCFPGNEAIAKRLGKSPRSVQTALDRLEAAGWIRRVFTEAKRRDRLGIILLRRTCGDLPAADTPERLARVETVLSEGTYAQWSTLNEESFTPRAKEPSLTRAKNSSPEEDVVVKKTQGKRSEARNFVSSQRQRPGPQSRSPHSQPLRPPGSPPPRKKVHPNQRTQGQPPGPGDGSRPDDPKPIGDTMAAMMGQLSHLAPKPKADDAEASEPAPEPEPATKPEPEPKTSEPSENPRLSQAETAAGIRAIMTRAATKALGAAPDAPEGEPEPLTIPAGVEISDAELSALRDKTAKSQALILAMLASGDPVVADDARKKLQPMPVDTTPPPHLLTTEDMLTNIRANPSYPIIASDRLAREFGDAKSLNGFKARLMEAFKGDIDPAALVEAYRRAKGPKAKNPGAIFMHVLK